MLEEDCEIEYLDEDEDLVQQCVQSTSSNKIKPLNNPVQPMKTKGKYEDDKDYTPNVFKKKKDLKLSADPLDRKGSAIVYPSSKNKLTYSPMKNDILTQRKVLNVRIPDYEDPLCLPVHVIKLTEVDHKRLKNWNHMCLDQFSLRDTMFRPDTGKESVKSTRTVVFKNVQSRTTGRPETSVWSKTTCEDDTGERKSALFQCTLPKYKSKTTTRIYSLAPNKNPSVTRHVDTALLTKEVSNEEESLVVYKPNDFVSAVYMFEENEGDTKENMRRLKEMALCKMCVLCYQTSWRGFRKDDKKTIVCAICKRSQISVYSLLAHLKTHTDKDVRAHRKNISRLLASVVDYHYKCRVCLKKFDSIKVLRKHVSTHKGIDMFHCEVGSHHTM